MAHTYTVAEARTLLARLRSSIESLVAVRADTAELSAAVRSGTPSRLGGVPELKAAQARFDELLSELTSADLQVKGVAPLLLDFPAELGGESVLLCWLEGDSDLEWYHRVDLGFAGRRPLREPRGHAWGS